MFQNNQFRDLFNKELDQLSKLAKPKDEPDDSDATLESEAATPEKTSRLNESGYHKRHWKSLEKTLRERAPLAEKTSPPTAKAGPQDTQQDTVQPSVTDEMASDHPTAEPLSRLQYSKTHDDPNSEPYVSFLSSDLVGLALSGGGIRSATFNLGVLQGLNSLKLLSRIDYLSTVSGGGYIGGWWTAFQRSALKRAEQEAKQSKKQERKKTPLFPESHSSDDSTQERHTEPDEIRHLREFSNFLSPRRGLFSSDMWRGIIAILGGLIPTVLMAASVMLIAAVGLLIVAALLQPSGGLTQWIRSSAAVGAICGGILLTYEWIWLNKQKQASDEGHLEHKSHLGWALFMTLCIMVAVPAAGEWTRQLEDRQEDPHHFFATYMMASLYEPVDASRSLQYKIAEGVKLSIATDPAKFKKTPFTNYRLLSPCIGIAIACFLVLTVRYLPIPLWKNSDASSRVVGRAAITAIIWLAFWLTWEGTLFLFEKQMSFKGLGSLLVSAEFFRRAIGWVSQTSSSSQQGSPFLEKALRLLPQVLAYAVITLAFMLTLLILQICFPPLVAKSLPVWFGLIGGGAVTLLAWIVTMLNPESLGLHAFYRDRIARTYLGASNDVLRATHPRNRQTITHKDDDFLLSGLAENPIRPIQLVCCAANDLRGDHIGNLRRGARSAVLSGNGFALGNYVCHPGRITMAMAQTASAAAFNSNMGSKSMVLGPGVSFLLAALNLRLGLWLNHPATAPVGNSNAKEPSLGGLSLLMEMFSRTTSGMLNWKTPASKKVHLSDGAHFENLALYELVRRHCRYIIVSDCGADPQVAFDDFGNAIRRIRQDFGVEIEIDLSPLKSNSSGLARAHVAVGTIHYQQAQDKGILIFLKPNLTGDEPDDVTQYRTRNSSFPNETTIDQFYDEAQWESYRRLGEHTAHSAFRFCESVAASELTPQLIFSEAFWKYAPKPDDLSQSMLELTDKFIDFQQSLRQSDCIKLFHEMYPELGDAPTNRKTSAKDLLMMTELFQLMEDTYVAAHLETHHQHPMNAGWNNLFHRAAQSSTVKAWWPILQPIYSRDFRHFVNREFSLTKSHRSGMITFPTHQNGVETLNVSRGDNAADVESFWSGLSGAALRKDLPSDESLEIGKDHRLYELMHDVQSSKVQIAGLVVQLQKAEATWNHQHLCVPPGLWGTGIGTWLVSRATDHLFDNTPEIERCIVTLDDVPTNHSPEIRDEASRFERANLIRFYTSLGFQPEMQGKQVVLVKPRP